MNSTNLSSVAIFILVVSGVASATARAQHYVMQEVMSGLVSPRGLAFGPDGGLYVAEAGSGGDGASIILGTGDEGFYGTTAGLSRLLNGAQERVLDHLPSIAATTAVGLQASGLADIAFDNAGTAYGIIGLAADPTTRGNLGAPGADFSTLVRLPLDGSPFERIADLGAHEIANNPDEGHLETNPFGLALLSDGAFLVADAGGNSFLAVSSAGTVSTLGVLPNRENPLPVGPPTFQAVPTTIAVGPDNAYYIGQLTGFPFPPGAANIYRFDPATNELSVAHSGFTNITDFTFDDEGNLYILQITTNGLASAMGPGPGALIRIDATTGDRATIASEGLMFPGSVLAGPDGAIYVTNRITSEEGQVLRLALVPEPTTSVLLVLGLVGCLAWRRPGQVRSTAHSLGTPPSSSKRLRR